MWEQFEKFPIKVRGEKLDRERDRVEYQNKSNIAQGSKFLSSAVQAELISENHLE